MTWLKTVALATVKLFLGLGILIVLLLGILYWKGSSVEVAYEAFSVLESGDGAHVLTVETANPVLPYGPHFVAITVARVSGAGPVVEKKTRLSNDGARIDEGNISVRWLDTNTASVCLRGDEQGDVRILINAVTRNVDERQEQCQEMFRYRAYAWQVPHVMHYGHPDAHRGLPV
jgi:hypothetical protein